MFARPVMIDMSPLKAGGGCQLALNFLVEMNGREDASTFLFLIPDIGPLAEVANRFENLHFVRSPTSSPWRRIYFETRRLPRVFRKYGTRTIYTFFGAGLPHTSHIRSIVSVAYPIICYPDSPYWEYCSKFTALRQRALNAIRIHRLRKADTIVAETTVMQARLASVLSRPIEDIVVRPPKASSFVTPRHRPASWDGVVNLLVLSGAAQHKNVWRIPQVDRELAGQGASVRWTMSMTRDAFLAHLSPEDRSLVLDQEARFSFLGTVPPDSIQACYERADALVSLSDLESFSNNYLESWVTGTPLIVSDRDFARAICGDAAIYIEPHDPASAAHAIAETFKKPNELNRLLKAGRHRLAMLEGYNRTDAVLQLVKDWH